jgi:hypothetical protein
MRACFARVFNPWAVAAGLAVASLFQPPLAAAAVLDFDFTTIPGSNPLASQVNAGGVTAHGFFLDGGTYQDAALWKRNQSDDHGLGICSEKTDSCKEDGGDVNEISNQKNLEVLRLTLPSGKKWTSLWVSSLDDGGSKNNEMGTLYWSNLEQPDLSSLSSSFLFKHSNLGSEAEGNLFAISGFPAGFDPTAKYLFFRAGPNPDGQNNDYLVWGGNLSAVPEPSSTLMLLAGLAVTGSIALRRRHAV